MRPVHPTVNLFGPNLVHIIHRKRTQFKHPSILRNFFYQLGETAYQDLVVFRTMNDRRLASQTTQAYDTKAAARRRSH